MSLVLPELDLVVQQIYRQFVDALDAFDSAGLGLTFAGAGW